MSQVEAAWAADPPHLPRSGQSGAGSDSKPSRCSKTSTATSSNTPDHASSSSQDRSTSGERSRSSGRDETRRTARRRSVSLVAEASGDIDAFVHELDQKRKQLDEQIHKFIAQKEREFKRYEQEICRQYQNTPVSRHSQDEPQSAMLVQSPVSQSPTTHNPGPARTPMGEDKQTQDPGNARSRIDQRSATSGLEDLRPSYEREKDFMGLFTPSFLPLLDGKPDVERSPSAPDLTNLPSGAMRPDRQLQRANTEPLLDAEGNPRPTQGLRTPSSGSDGLVSALKTSGGRKNSKQLRVMLQLADDEPAVHPNDDLPTERDYAPVRQAEAMHHSKSSKPKVEDDSPTQSPSKGSNPPDRQPVDVTPIVQKPSGLAQGLALQTNNDSLAVSVPSSNPNSKADSYDDLASPFLLDEDVVEPQRPSELDWEVDFQENIDEDPEPSRYTLSPLTSEMDRSPILQSPAAAVEPSRNSGPPMMKIRSSSMSSNQPIAPGFSRPSVREDPIFDFLEKEQSPLENSVGPGSFYDSYPRQSLTGRGSMAGSLGESFMQRNAEALMRRKRT